MWYSVLRRECVLSIANDTNNLLTKVEYKAGTLFVVVGRVLNDVRLERVDAAGIPVDSGSFLGLSVDECRRLFTKPTQDLTDAIEESFMVCEAAYC